MTVKEDKTQSKIFNWLSSEIEYIQMFSISPTPMLCYKAKANHWLFQWLYNFTDINDKFHPKLSTNIQMQF